VLAVTRDTHVWIDVVQQPVQPVLRFASLSHQRLAVTRQQRDLALQIVRVAREAATAPQQVSRDPHTDGLLTDGCGPGGSAARVRPGRCLP
jgi:hypothetical protein